MKKISIIFILIIFLIANSGVVLSMHWCSKKLASISFFSEDAYNCPCGKRTMKPGCCKDKTILIQNNEDLAKGDFFKLKIDTTKLILKLVNQFEISFPLISLQFDLTNFYNPPPYKPKTPAYLIHGVFLI